MGWMIAAAILAVILLIVGYVKLARVSRTYEIRKERLIIPEVTIVPEPKEAVVIYPVPLDQELQDYIVKTSIENGVSPCIVFAVIETESDYDPAKMGDNGNSFGLMQIYKSVHLERMERLGVTDLLDPYQNVMVGIDYLSELLRQGDIRWALSFYNGNQGNPCQYSEIVLARAQQIYEGKDIREE